MNKYLLLLIFFFTWSISSFSQNRTVLHHEGTSTIFLGASQFQDAYNAAVKGDTIILPNGLLSVPSMLDKQLNIFGVGFHPDSSLAVGGITELNGNLSIRENADSLFIQGVKVLGNISIYTNHKVDYLRISRCMFNTLEFLGTGTTPGEHAIISESVALVDVSFNNAQYSDLTNCIIQRTIREGKFNSYRNNLLLNQTYYYTILGVSYSYFANNIIKRDGYGIYPTISSSSVYNTFEKNVFLDDDPVFATNTSVNNFIDVDETNLFVNQSGQLFDFTHDYHLTFPANYTGTDGNPVGLYGGLHPLKAGFVPKNPHFQFKNISNQTDSNGNLNIQIKVSSQNN